MKKIVFIVNPHSGNGFGKEIGRIIEEMIPTIPYECEIHYTHKRNDATMYAARYTKSDDAVIVSVGGDGTMNEVLNGIHAGVCMGIIPSGSGNDFFRLIDPEINDIKELIRQTIYGKVEYIDYGIVNQRKFLGSFSVGLDADVVMKAAEIQKKNKKVRKSAYVRAVMSEVFHPPVFGVHFEDASVNVNQECLLVSVMNGRYYGGGFSPAPEADYQDGLLDVNIVESMNTSKIIRLLPLYMKGKHYGCKEVIAHSTNHFTMVCDRVKVAQCDGELIEEKRFDVQIVNKGLPILLAKGE